MSSLLKRATMAVIVAAIVVVGGFIYAYHYKSDNLITLLIGFGTGVLAGKAVQPSTDNANV